MVAKLLIGTVLLGGAVLMQDGVISVNVREKHPGGHHIYFVAPGALIPWGIKLAAARHMQPEGEDAREWMPLARAAIEALERSPDCVFVQVDSAEEHARIEKSGRRLRIDVDDPNDEVHLAVPLGAVRHALRELEEMGPAS
jgi:hypothetical protein